MEIEDFFLHMFLESPLKKTPLLSSTKRGREEKGTTTPPNASNCPPRNSRLQKNIRPSDPTKSQGIRRGSQEPTANTSLPGITPQVACSLAISEGVKSAST